MNFLADKKNLRLDIFLSEKFPAWSRSHIQKIISDGKKSRYKLSGVDI